MSTENQSLVTIAASQGKTVSVVSDTYRIVIGGGQTDKKYALKASQRNMVRNYTRRII